MPTTFQSGCLFDGHHGHYTTSLVIELAWREGMSLDPFEEFAVNRYEECNADEDYPDLISQGGLLDKAVAWLNDNRGVPNHTFEFREGDFGLYPDEDDEDDS